MLIHGAFNSKAKAKAKERKVSGGFIVKRKIKGESRYVVLSKKS